MCCDIRQELLRVFCCLRINELHLVIKEHYDNSLKKMKERYDRSIKDIEERKEREFLQKIEQYKRTKTTNITQ